jgi:hypothetical protein
MEETGKHYCGFFNYKTKSSRGISLKMTRMVCCEETFQKALDAITYRKVLSSDIKDYHISLYDFTPEMPVKLEEYSLQ